VLVNPRPTFENLAALFNGRAWPRAAAMAETMMHWWPRQPMLYYIAGIAHLEQQRLPEALEYLGRATALAPDNAEFAVQHARALALARRTTDALAEADRARVLAPARASDLDTIGVVYTRIGAHDRAVEMFRLATAREPHHAGYRYNLATALVATGDVEEACQQISACLDRDPHHWRAYMTRAQLRRQTALDNHVEPLQRLLDEVGTDDRQRQARVCLHMALAKELEDLGRYPDALRHLTEGKAIAGSGREYASARDERLFRALRERFPAPSDGVEGYPSDEPIFVIGMPRTGTTLVERIISSHPDVHSSGELLNFGMALKALSGSRTRPLLDVETVERTGDVPFRALGRAYLESTRPATGHSPRFVDKLPHNFMYVGYIAQALPNARVICLRRNPMDTCLSNFRQLFAPESPFFDYSFDLLDVGRYYVLFDRLLDHWKHVFPGRVLEVEYETLVADQEIQSRRIIDFCGLPWDDRCLRFHANPSPVATASAVQVRAPIYKSAIHRWRKYGASLDPLRNLLIESGIDP